MAPTSVDFQALRHSDTPESRPRLWSQNPRPWTSGIPGPRTPRRPEQVTKHTVPEIPTYVDIDYLLYTIYRIFRFCYISLYYPISLSLFLSLSPIGLTSLRYIIIHFVPLCCIVRTGCHAVGIQYVGMRRFGTPRKHSHDARSSRPPQRKDIKMLLFFV